MTDSPRDKPLGSDEDMTRDLSAPAEQPGTMIGRYKLLQLIGEGGFGSVYMAEQERPVRRKVALKIIKLGMDTRQVIARFEAERQALALMDHPNIARVLDAGSTEKGRPYFVMELVRGVPITDYCDTNSLTTEQRLDLFLDVCGAIQHAHQKGIIHRDVKPSNVMVTLHDGKPVPKVIDFGIAKATNQRLTEKTLFTEYRQFIGTPQYMSPEQAEMSGLDVDTRADIYSLGVLLYELLTGTTPFDPQKLRSVAFTEIHRVIREEDPQKPSTRVSTLGDQATTAAKQRSTDVRALRKALSGDLDWIAMKALEKDRTRRYDTANALIQDVRRHRKNEPVSAGPPGAAYRTGKFLRRNRTAVAAGGAVAVALLAGLAVAGYGFLEARRGRESAREAAAAAQSVNAFFADMLASVNPMQLHLTSAFRVADLAPDVDATFAHDVSVADMLARSAQRAEESFTGHPELEATMREILGTTLLGLDEIGVALEQFRRAHALRDSIHGPDHVDALRSRVHVGEALMRTPDQIGAEESLESVVRDLERTRGPEDPISMYAAMLWATLITDRGSQMARADSLFQAVLQGQERVLGPDHRDTIRTLTSSAHVFTWQGNGKAALERAKEAHERAIRTYSPEDAVVLDNETVLGLSYAFLGQYDAAKEVLLRSLEKHRRVFGNDHPQTRYLAFSLARAHRDDDAKRIEYYRWAMGDRGDADVPLTDSVRWVATRDVCIVLSDLGRHDEALEILRPQIEAWSDPNREELKGFWPGRAATVLENLMGPYRVALEGSGRGEELSDFERTRLRRLKTAADAADATWQDLNVYAYAVLVVAPEELRNPMDGLRYARKAVDLLPDGTGVEAGLTYDTLAKALEARDDLPGALREERRSVGCFLALGLDHRLDAVRSAVQAVLFASKLGDPAACAAVVDRILGEARDWYADDASSHALFLIHFADQIEDRGLLEEAESPARAALEAAESSGDDDVRSRARSALAYVVGEAGDTATALELANEARDLHRAAWGSEPPGDEERATRALGTKSMLVPAFLAARRPETAAELHREYLSEIGRTESWHTPRVLALSGSAPEAEAAWRARVDVCRGQGFDKDEAWTLGCYEAGLARSLMERGRWEEAEELLAGARRRLREWCGPRSVHTLRVERRLAAAERRELDPWSPGGW